jgi:hypothetical protein
MNPPGIPCDGQLQITISITRNCTVTGLVLHVKDTAVPAPDKLDEQGVVAVFDHVGDVGAAQGVEVDAVREPEPGP